VDELSADESPELIPFPAPPPWYPGFPTSQYSWYFRSNDVTYGNGTLTIQIIRHLWNRAAQEFVSTDQDTPVLTCRQSLVTIPIADSDDRHAHHWWPGLNGQGGRDLLSLPGVPR
jgi:hypothetical protein